MRLNKLLLLLLTLPLAFVSCNKQGETTADPVLTLTSNDTMTFDAKGGQAEITYTLANPVEGTELTATSEAEWITDLTAGDKVTFTVAANEDAARETMVVVAYGSQKFEVKVRQNEKEVEKSDAEPLSVAERIDPEDINMQWPDNYILIAMADNIYYTQLFILLAGAEGENILTAGTYTSENGGAINEYCELYVGEEEEYLFKDGNVEVVVDGDINGYTFDIKLSDNKGNSFHYAYQGKVPGMNPEGDAIGYLEGYDYGIKEETGAYNYFLILSDTGLTEDHTPKHNSKNYIIDLYSSDQGVVDAEGYITLPVGTYELDTNNTFNAGTFSYKHSSYAVVGSGNTGNKYQFQEGEIVVTENSITIKATINNDQHHIVYNGVPRFMPIPLPTE